MEKIKDFFDGVKTWIEFSFFIILLIIGYPFYKKPLKEMIKAIIEHKD